MNILITGIGGYIGKNLVSCLNGIQNFNIYGLDIKKEKIEGVKKIYLWDELEKIDDICCVIHLAGLAHDLIGLNSLSNYLSINLGLTQKIFEWSIDRRVKKFIFFSSVKAVSDKPNSSFFSFIDVTLLLIVVEPPSNLTGVLKVTLPSLSTTIISSNCPAVAAVLRCNKKLSVSFQPPVS